LDLQLKQGKSAVIRSDMESSSSVLRGDFLILDQIFELLLDQLEQVPRENRKNSNAFALEFLRFITHH